MTKDQSRQKNDNYDNKRGKSQTKSIQPDIFIYKFCIIVIIYILFVKSTNRIQQRIKNYKL